MIDIRFYYEIYKAKLLTRKWKCVIELEIQYVHAVVSGINTLAPYPGAVQAWELLHAVQLTKWKQKY